MEVKVSFYHQWTIDWMWHWEVFEIFYTRESLFPVLDNFCILGRVELEFSYEDREILKCEFYK